MTKPFSILAHYYKDQSSLENLKYWYVSRKYNGIGAIWDGGITRGVKADKFPFYKRGGDKTIPVSTGLWTIGRDGGCKVVSAPNFWLDDLPKGVPCQGELWCKDDLQYVSSVCRKKIPAIMKWYAIQFIIYNIKPYSLWEEISAYHNPKNKYIKDESFLKKWNLFDPNRFKSGKYWRTPAMAFINTEYESVDIVLNSWFDSCKGQGWEGLMFQAQDSKYECKRSYTLLKYKPDYETEGEICEHIEGKTGKNVGKVGCISASLTWDDKVLSIPGGKEEFIGKRVSFSVSGLTDEERDWDDIGRDYPIGDDINFTFKGVSIYGVPQSCNINRRV